MEVKLDKNMSSGKFLEKKIPKWVYEISSSKYIVWIFGVLSFLESFIFPVPVDILSMIIVSVKKNEWIKYTIIGILASVFGGIFGYAFGFWLSDIATVYPTVVSFMENSKAKAGDWFIHGTFFAMLISAATPIPYKVFTITGGIFHAPLLPFVLGSLLGRGLRYGTENYLASLYGEKALQYIINLIYKIGWGIAVIAFIIFVIVLF